MHGQGSSLSGDSKTLLCVKYSQQSKTNIVLQICVTCLSSESVESRTTPKLFVEAEEVTDEVTT